MDSSVSPWADRNMVYTSMSLKIACLFFLAFSITAEDKPKVDPPKITDSLRAAYWKAVAEEAQANALHQQTVTALQKAFDGLKAACGTELIRDNEGEPQCKIEKK